MTTKNSILLIVKQNRGIDYNSLLAKIASNYSSINSARAALSRALKDALAFGLMQKQTNSFFITEKGTALINSEMKNKLLMKLNQLINSKASVSEIDSIVRELQTLIERSKADNDLLKAARGSTDFFISDLIELQEKLSERVKHLTYLQKIFSSQIDALKELNFNDLKKFELSKENLEKIALIPEKLKLNEFFIESNDLSFLEKVSERFSTKARDTNVFLEKQNLKELLELIKENFLTDSSKNLSIYFATLKITIQFPFLYFKARFKELNELIKQIELK